MQNRSTQFLIKYILIIFLTAFFMQLKKQLFPSEKQEIFHIELLNMDGHFIDSMISSMTDSTKIELLLGSNLFFIDTLNYNMITDSSFLNEYFNYRLSKSKQQKKLFYAYYPAKSDVDNLKDSSFFNFLIKRYQQINKIAQKNGLIAGWVYKENIHQQLEDIDDTLKKQFSLQRNFLKTQNAFHIFESSYITHTHLEFEGLKILKNTEHKAIDKEILDFLNADFDIILLKPDEKKEAAKIISELVKKYPLYKKQFYKKLRKITKYVYYLQNNLSVNKTSRNKNNEQLMSYLLNEKSIFIVQKNKNIQVPLPTGIVYSILNLTDSLSNSFLNIFNNYTSYTIVNQKNNYKNDKKKFKRNRHIILIDNSTLNKFTIDSLNKLLYEFPIDKNIIINFGDFDILAQLTDSLNMIQMPNHSGLNDSLAPQVLFGGLDISGQIPRSLNKQIRFGTSIKQKATRLGYTSPERVKVSSKKLTKINRIVHEAIQAGAFPGCQIFIVKNGKVIYNQSFGYHTYQKLHKVKNTDLYDLASLTKIAATTIAAMKMLNDKKLSINDKLAKFFKDTKIDYTRIKPDTLIKIDTFTIKNIQNIENFVKNKDTLNIDSVHFISIDTLITKLTPANNIFNVQLFDLLKHKSGITPTLPIYKYIYYRYIYFKELIKSHKNFQKQLAKLLRMPYIEVPDTLLKQMHLPDSIDSIINTELKNIYYGYFSKIKTDSSRIQICENLYLRNNYFDTIWQDTKQLPVSNKKYTQYSDINMILLQMAIDSLNRAGINQYLKKEIYNPLGLRNIDYLPLKRFRKNRIIPTENDVQWRYELLQGYVHDPSAAILGGVSGNAGLFANAQNLGVLFQMILNGGKYGGKQFIRSDIIKQFTTRQEDTQRGLGFDMPNSHAVVGNLAPASTYGHSGFTGTCIWVDPENNLIYIFLSNRVYPSAKNWKIISLHIRERIHDAIYEAIIDK
ncbi:MAG: serine hydrolase [Bacteroidales bacterium]|nr:serine hydrolase [Bacteroidales bacterium]